MGTLTGTWPVVGIQRALGGTRQLEKIGIKAGAQVRPGKNEILGQDTHADPEKTQGRGLEQSCDTGEQG